jgi:hypothetical protein
MVGARRQESGGPDHHPAMTLSYGRMVVWSYGGGTLRVLRSIPA